MIFYFSATGNSEFVAEKLAKRLDENSLGDITNLLCQNKTIFSLRADETVGFVFPIYGWSLPNIVRTFISRLKLANYSNQYTYFVVTCGDDIGIADRHIAQALANIGLRIDAGYSVIMPDSYICLPGFEVDSDSKRRDKYAVLNERIDHIATDIKQRRIVMDVKHGVFAQFKTKVLGALFHRYLVTDKYFRTTDDCIKCGKCVEVCPLHNITLTDKIEWHGNCTGCLACYHHCPTRSVRFGRFTDSKGQYLLSRYRGEIS